MLYTWLILILSDMGPDFELIHIGQTGFNLYIEEVRIARTRQKALHNDPSSLGNLGTLSLWSRGGGGGGAPCVNHSSN